MTDRLPDRIGARCPRCDKNDWHNSWLCRRCGYPDERTWKEYIAKGYIRRRERDILASERVAE